MTTPIFIYSLSHPTTGEVRYVGKANSLKRRLQSHIDYARTSTKRRPISDWITSLSSEGLKPLIRLIEETTNEEWPGREKYWIARLKIEGKRLLNLTDGGESNFGYVYSSELKEIRRQARLGHKTPSRVRLAIAKTLSKEIICLQSGEVFKSMKDAIVHIGIPKSTFHRKIHKREEINGKHYQFITWYNTQTHTK